MMQNIDMNNIKHGSVTPIAHGRQEFSGDDYIICSVCGARYYTKWLVQSYCTGIGDDKINGFHYCPHCGTKMD